jgi:hypothetical protein
LWQRGHDLGLKVRGRAHLATGLRLLGDPRPELDVALRVATADFGLIELAIQPRMHRRRRAATGVERHFPIAQRRGFALTTSALATVLGTTV